MSIHAHMSAAAQRRRIERDQTTTTTLTQAEQIAVKFECAIGMTKQVGFPDIQARGEMLVKEYEIQLRGLAEFADEYAEAFHIEEDEQEDEAGCCPSCGDTITTLNRNVCQNCGHRLREEPISDYDAWLAAEKQYAHDGSKENRAAVWLAWKKIHPTASPYHF